MSFSKGDKVIVTDEKLAHEVLADVANGDKGVILRDYGDGFVEVDVNDVRWAIQEGALALVEASNAN